MNASKHEQRKSRTSKEYQDSKLIEPELIRSDQISQELKFQLDKAETEAETESETEPQTVPAQEVGYEGMEAVSSSKSIPPGAIPGPP